MTVALDQTGRSTPYNIVPFTLDEGVMYRAAIGLIVLATDQTIEYEWRQIMKIPGVAFFEARLHSSPDIQPASLALMENEIEAAVKLIVPDITLHTVGFGCTSGTVVIGEENVFARIRAVRPEVACTSPITAAVAGLNVLGAKRIGLLTPYVESINALFQDHLEGQGISVSRVASFNHADDNEVARIDRASLKKAVLQLGREEDVDAVFVSCTSLRMFDLIAEVEQELGKPVISSNCSMAWHVLRLSGVNDVLPQFGRLFEN